MNAAPETPEHAPPRGRHRRSSRGAWTIVAIFAVGLAVMAGLMLVPRNKPPRAPAEAPWGVPGEPLSVVTCDLSGRQVSPEALAAEVRSLAGTVAAGGAGADSFDFLILAHIGADDAMALARVMGMQASYRPQHHQRARAGGERVGVCILSRHPLYEGGPLRIDRKRSAGVSAVAVAGGRKFRVACLYAGDAEGGWVAALLEQRKAEGAPPTLLALAGDAGTSAGYRELLSQGFVEVGPRGVASDFRLLATRQWRPMGAVASRGGLVWQLLGAAESSTTPATNPE